MQSPAEPEQTNLDSTPAFRRAVLHDLMRDAETFSCFNSHFQSIDSPPEIVLENPETSAKIQLGSPVDLFHRDDRSGVLAAFGQALSLVLARPLHGSQTTQTKRVRCTSST